MENVDRISSSSDLHRVYQKAQKNNNVLSFSSFMGNVREETTDSQEQARTLENEIDDLCWGVAIGSNFLGRTNWRHEIIALHFGVAGEKLQNGTLN